MGRRSGALYWVVTSITQQYEGHAMQAAGFAALCNTDFYGYTRYSIVVDDDVDPSNNDEVIWALSTRTDPASDIDILRHGLSSPLDPIIAPDAVRNHTLYSNRGIINACIPYDRLASKNFPPVVKSAPAALEAIKHKWATLFDR